MATLLLQAAGAALGSVFGPVGAIIGRAAGALAGSVVDHALLGGTSTVRGAHLSTARIPGADEGTAINRLYGAARIGGTMIWATRFEEQVTSERTGGKSSGGTRVETYRYFANMAIGLCEGPVASLRRVWADGKELDLSRIEMRFYPGDDEQQPDPLIEAKQGAGMAPAYRGLAYVVFERLPLDAYGNRIPLLQFEVVRSVGALESEIRAVCVIPGATEHGYRTVTVSEKTGSGSARRLNRNTLRGQTDWEVSIDELMTLCPNLERVALVVSWFGTDLRAGSCKVLPGVEVSARSEESSPWSVSGVARANAYRVSRSNGGPAYGGTPDDASVVSAIADLKARGLKVYLYPFLMMDIPADNVLPDPYGAERQQAYPWRGRLTCHPAIGEANSADRTALARGQVQSFAGPAQASDFTVSGQHVSYRGGDAGYRRFILHYGQLAKAAGGVDGFIIGSELRGLTSVRDGADAFPFVETLTSLASAVKTLLPSAKLTYGADWSEYFGYHPDDGSGDVLFNLDPLWASPAIDAVGIDNYMPLSDWRDEDLGAANPDGFRAADDLSALTTAITTGEGFDWYYRIEADRRDRVRTPITDGGGKPWLYRYKDIAAWWSNPHHERIAGVESAAATAWTPSGKPVWFTELGCGAIDKGANQPNVFADPKSAESAVPYFSNGTRSDATQRRFLQAHHQWWAGDTAPSGMVDPGHLFVWAWDARPYPAFPQNTALWSDGANWPTGHWLNGRLGGGTLADVISTVLGDHGFADFDVSGVSGDVTGYVQGDITSARSLIEPLLQAFQVDAFEDGGLLRFRSRMKASLPPIELDTFVDDEDEPLWQETRGHGSDFAAEAVLTFYDPAQDYEQASVRSHRAAVGTNRVIKQDLTAVMSEEAALAAAEALLRDNRIARQSIRFSLSPNAVHLQPGDVVSLSNGPVGRFLISRIEDGDSRSVEARAFSPSAGSALREASGGRTDDNGAADIFAPVVLLMDLPRFDGGDAAGFARGAVFAKPWTAVGLSSSATGEGYKGRVLLDRPARIGSLAGSLGQGVLGRFDWSQALEIDLPYGGLSSADAVSVLNGANLLAVLSANGAWEVLSFRQAQEIAAGRWRLEGLLRGLAGTDDAMRAGAVSGASAVLLDEAVKPLGLGSDEMGLRLNWIAETAASTGKAGPFAFEGGVRAQTPLAPVHLRCARDASGAAVFSWIRRGREEADGWTASDIPLDEPYERYAVELLDGETVVRSIEADQPQWTYPPADEAADFGSAQSNLIIRVRQLGQRVPLGLPALASFSI